MANTFIYRLILGIAVFAASPFVSFAGDGIVHRFGSSMAVNKMRMVSDTVPPPKKPADADADQDKTPDKTNPDIIKEVPKARKQVKPIAVPNVPVVPKTIRIIKPKIIKRII